jgi:DNA-binding Lrp family transcriptional regulator
MKELSRTMKGEQRLIELRRAKVMELLSNGHTSQVSIAETLNVSEPTVSRDIRYLKDKAKKELEIHFQEKLPFEYARALAGINATLSRVSELLKEAKDPKTKIECMKLQMDLWKSVMSMATDGGIIQRAMAVIERLGSSTGETKLQNNSLQSDGDLQTIVTEESSNDEQDEDIIDAATESKEEPKEE